MPASWPWAHPGAHIHQSTRLTIPPGEAQAVLIIGTPCIRCSIFKYLFCNDPKAEGQVWGFP